MSIAALSDEYKERFQKIEKGVLIAAGLVVLGYIVLIVLVGVEKGAWFIGTYITMYVSLPRQKGEGVK